MNRYEIDASARLVESLPLTLSEEGAYSRLLDVFYWTERPIPHETRFGVTRCCSAKDRAATDRVLRLFFERREEGWVPTTSSHRPSRGVHKFDADRRTAIPPAVRAEVLARAMVCGICEKPIIGKPDIDHVVPVSLGGDNSPENLQLAHQRCNRAKGNRMGATQ